MHLAGAGLHGAHPPNAFADKQFHGSQDWLGANIDRRLFVDCDETTYGVARLGIILIIGRRIDPSGLFTWSPGRRSANGETDALL
jgi:hypothetical protein